MESAGRSAAGSADESGSRTRLSARDRCPGRSRERINDRDRAGRVKIDPLRCLTAPHLFRPPVVTQRLGRRAAVAVAGEKLQQADEPPDPLPLGKVTQRGGIEDATGTGLEGWEIAGFTQGHGHGNEPRNERVRPGRSRSGFARRT